MAIGSLMASSSDPTLAHREQLIEETVIEGPEG
jgi:hypothetical protein